MINMDTGKDFDLRVISNQARFGCGFRTINGKKQYFAWHGYANRNDDFFTTSEITLDEYDRINTEYPKEIIADRETAEVFRQKYVDGHLVLMEGWNKLPNRTEIDAQRYSIARLRGSSCIFPVPDIIRTAGYYVCKLGFTAVGYLDVEQPHVCLYLDQAEIILLKADKDRVQSNRELYGYGYDAYFYTDNQVALEERLLSRGVNVVRPLKVTDYQNKEFVIEDIDGRWLAFGSKQPED